MNSLRPAIWRTIAGTKWRYDPPPRKQEYLPGVRFISAMASISRRNSNSEAGGGRSRPGLRFSGGMSRNSSSTESTPMASSIRRRSSRVLGVYGDVKALPSIGGAC